MKGPNAPWFRWWVGAFTLYLLLVWKIALGEMLVGAAAAALTATAAEAARRGGMAQLDLDVHWLRRARRLPRGMLSDTLLLTATLWRHLTGRRQGAGEFRVVTLEAGGDDARSATRRALVITALTLTPNTIVVSFEQGEDHLLVHQLAPDDGKSIAVTLGRS